MRKRSETYASRTLNKSERNYEAHKLEFLALKWTITDRFHECLYGATFDVFTDNNPLTYILSTTKLDAMGHRLVASLGPYNFTLYYKPSKLNNDADTLSQIDWNTLDPTEVKATMDLAQVDRTLILEVEVHGGQAADASFVMKGLGLVDDTRKWIRRQNEDPEIRKIIGLIQGDEWESYRYSKQEPDLMKCYVKVRNELEIENGLLYCRIRLKDCDEDSYQFVFPVKYRTLALELLHDKFGHLGIDRTSVVYRMIFLA